jgi:hypothetical protein
VRLLRKRGSRVLTERTAGLDTRHVAEERRLVSDGYVVDAVVSKERHCRERRGLLASVLGAGRDEDGRELGVLFMRGLGISWTMTGVYLPGPE